MHEGPERDLTENRIFVDRLQGFTNLCQALAGAAQTRELPLNVIAKRIVGALPEPNSAPDFFLLRSTLLEFVAGTAAITQADAESSLTALTTLIHVRPPTGDLAAAVTRCLSVLSPTTAFAHATRLQSRAERAAAIIANRCTDSTFSVQELADALGVSPAYVSKLLRASSGRGFRRAVAECRIRKARQQLTTSTKSVKEIAIEVGYRSTSQFDHDFKRACGMRPGEYRREHVARKKPN